MKKKFAAREGFTLVELIVVIAILGILAAVAVPAYSGYIGKANEAADITLVDAVKTAAQAALATKGEVTGVEITVSSSDPTVKVTYKDAAGTSTTIADITDNSATGYADFKAFFTSSLAKFSQTGMTKATWPKSTTDNSWSFSAS